MYLCTFVLPGIEAKSHPRLEKVTKERPFERIKKDVFSMAIRYLMNVLILFRLQSLVAWFHVPFSHSKNVPLHLQHTN